MKQKLSVLILIHFSCFAFLSSAVEKRTLAILHFENKTGEGTLEYLRRGLAEWLIADLGQSKHINVLNADRLHEICVGLGLLDQGLYSAEDLILRARRFRISHVMQGHYVKDDEMIVISAELWDSHLGKVIWSFKRGCTAEDAIPPIIDKMSREIKEALALSQDQIDGDLDGDVAMITTALPEAYRYYMQGREQEIEGQDQAALFSYQKAVEIDPEFALAHWRIGMAFPEQRLSSFSKKAEALRKALEMPGRLSVRARYWIESDFQSMTRYRYARALEACGKLLELYGDDEKGCYDLGLLYFDIEDWGKAASVFGALVDAKHESYALYQNLASAYINLGAFDEAQAVLQSFLDSVRDNVNIYLTLARNYRYQGKYEQAHRVADKAISLYPGVASCHADKGDIYLYSGDLDKAEAQYRTLLNSADPPFHNLGLFRLAELYLLQGRFRDSRALAKQGLERARGEGNKGVIRDRLSFAASLDHLTGHSQEALNKLDALWKTTLEDEELEWQRFVVYRKGFVYAETGATDLALAEAEKLEDLISRGLAKKKMRLFYHLMGVIEMRRKNHEKAIEYLEQSLPGLDSIRSRLNIAVADSLASAYSKTGDLEKARKEYDRMAAFPRGRQFYGDIYARHFYRLAEIYEKEGLKDKAIKHYQIFLDLWKNADLYLDEVAHAEKRLVELKGR